MRKEKHLQSRHSAEARWERAQKQFVKVELDTARNSLKLAMATGDPPARARYLHLARIAYESASRFNGLLRVEPSEAALIARQLEDLRARLEGWVHDGNRWTRGALGSQSLPKTIDEQVREFRDSCQRIQREARQMLAKNRTLLFERQQLASRLA